MRQSVVNRTVLVSLALGSVVGGLVFIGALAAALYFSAADRSARYVILFFMAGLPLFSGVSAVLLGLTARSQVRRGASVGTYLMALYSLAYIGAMSFVALYALYAPGS